MGWIKLDRSIFDTWLWSDGTPFDYRSAWIDLILLANYEDKKTAYKGQIIWCKRGEVNLSITFLAKRWGWSRDKVRRFLKLLEADEMVATKSTTHRTTITLVNYGKFQDLVTTKPTTDEATSRQQAATTKNIKKDKNIRIYTPNPFCQIEQQKYDIDEIEKEMLSN